MGTERLGNLKIRSLAKIGLAIAALVALSGSADDVQDKISAANALETTLKAEANALKTDVDPEAIVRFQADYDRYALALMDATVAIEFQVCQKEVERLQQDLSDKSKQAWETVIQSESKYREFRQTPKSAAGNRDLRAVDAQLYIKFFGSAADFYTTLKQGPKGPSPLISSALRHGLKLLGPFLATFKNLVFNGQSQGPQSPILDSFSHTMAQTGRALGFRVIAEGQIPPPPSSHSRTIQMILINHQNWVLDFIAFEDLGINQTAILQRPIDTAPKFLVELLKKNDHILALDQGTSAEDLIDQAVSVKGLRRLVVFSESNAHAAIGDTRPNLTAFLRLFKSLYAKGYEIEIVPVSLPSAYQTLSKPLDRATKTATSRGGFVDYRAIVHPTIDAKTVRATIEGPSPKALLEKVRQLWIEDRAQEIDSETGLPSLSELYRELQIEIRGAPFISCLDSYSSEP